MLQATVTLNSDNSVIASVQCPDQNAVNEWQAANQASWGDSSTWTLTTTDITSQVQWQAAINQGIQAQGVGAQVIAVVRALNGIKGLSPSQILTVLNDPGIQQIIMLLRVGGLTMAKAQLLSLSPLPYLGVYTQDDLNKIIAVLDASGLDN